MITASNDSIPCFVFGLVAACLFLVSAALGTSRTADSVRDWAHRNGLELLSMKLVLWQRVFFWTNWGLAYRVIVRTETGMTRRAWVRASAWSERVTVKWDPEGLCEVCGYDLRGLPEPRCPECGTPFDEQEIGPKSP